MATPRFLLQSDRAIRSLEGAVDRAVPPPLRGRQWKARQGRRERQAKQQRGAAAGPPLAARGRSGGLPSELTPQGVRGGLGGGLGLGLEGALDGASGRLSESERASRRASQLGATAPPADQRAGATWRGEEVLATQVVEDSTSGITSQCANVV